MTINESINNAIREHLPGMVGDQLRELLASGEKAAARVRFLESELETAHGAKRRAEAEGEKLQAMVKSDMELSKRERDIVEREKKCEIAEAVHAERLARLADLKEVTLSVFANNRFKYEENGTVPVMAAGNLYPTCGSVTKSVVVQG